MEFIFDLCKSQGELLNIGGVDCSSNEELCQQEEIYNTPQFYIYYGNNKRENIKIYKGLKFNFVIQQNLNFMEKLVQTLTHRNYQQKMSENVGKRIVILFSKRVQPSLLYSTLAIEFKKFFVFFQVQMDDQLSSNFRVYNEPTLLIVEDPASYKTTEFHGQINKKSLYKFLTENQKSKVQTDFVQELTKERVEMGACGNEDKKLCVISVVPQGMDVQQIREILKGFKEKYKNDAVDFYYIRQNQLNLNKFKSQFENNQTIFLRGKRKRYQGLPKTIKESQHSIPSHVDDILGGNFSSQPYNDLKSVFE